MSDWFRGTLVALDLETTGLDPENDRIVQVAVVSVGANGSIGMESWDGIINPGVEIPTEASSIHGITTERARREGVQPAEALLRIASLVEDAESQGVPLVIYNAPFDWPFVLAEAKRHGVALPARPNIIDPLVLDRAVDKYRPGSRRLEDVAAHYDYQLGNAHDAREDTFAAIAVARAIGAVFPEVGGLSPEVLQGQQARWFAEYAESLAEHLGRPIDGGWPIPHSVAQPA